MSFFDKALVPLRQEIDEFSHEGTEAPAVAKGGESAAAAAAPAVETDELTDVVLEASPLPEPVIGSPKSAVAEEDDKKEPPGIATAVGKLAAQPNEKQRAFLAATTSAIRQMQKQSRMADLQVLDVEQEAMADAEFLFESDHDKADELIGRALASYRNRTEELDRQKAEYLKSEIEPGRIFGNMTGAGRFAAALNVAVGQMAATGAGGPNAAMSLVENAITRDILAQTDNRNALLNAVNLNRSLRTEEWQQLQSELATQAEQRTLAFSHLRQRIARAKGAARSLKEKNALDMFDALAEAKEIEADVAARDARLSVELKGKLKSAAHAARTIREIAGIEQEFYKATGTSPHDPGDAASLIPEHLGGQKAVSPERPLAAPERPETAPGDPAPSPTTTERVMEERRQRKGVSAPASRVSVEVGEVKVGEEALEEGVVADIPGAEPVTPEAAEAELRDIETEKVTLSVPERAKRDMGLPPPAGRGLLVDATKVGTAEAAKQSRAMWENYLETHRPTLTPEEVGQLSKNDQRAYEQYKKVYDWVENSGPAVFEEIYATGQTQEDREANFVMATGLTLESPDKVTRYRVRQDSELRDTLKTKRGSEGSDPMREWDTDVIDAAKTIRDSAETADMVERIGLPGGLDFLGRGPFQDAEIRMEPVLDAQGNPTSEFKPVPIGFENDAVVVQEFRRIKQMITKMAAKYVKAFDPTSRLSDQDMRIAMGVLGISNIDTLVAGIMNASISNNGAMLKGYADFLRAFGDDTLRDFRTKWTQKGVIFDPRTSMRHKAELRKTINGIKQRQKTQAD